MGDEDSESTLLQIRECFVYKIPPRQTNAGYKAADWHLSTPLWTGRCTIVARGDNCTIKLENQTGELFAACPISGSTQQCVESVTDSSRYFVVRIDDGHGHHTFVGLGFTERSDAFDFNVALSDHEKHLRMMREQKQAANKLGTQPKVDYSLKDGQTITVKIATKGGVTGTEGRRQDDSGPAVLTALPPPPGAKARAHAHPQQQQQQPLAAAHDVGWGDFQAPTAPAAPQGGAYFANLAAQPAASPYPPQALAGAPVSPQVRTASPQLLGGSSPQVMYPPGVAQQSLFGAPQQQPPQGISPQMMAAPSPQYYAPPSPQAPPQQSLFGQPQQQPQFVQQPPLSPQVPKPAAQPTPGGFMNFGAPAQQQQWGAFAAPQAKGGAAPQQQQYSFN